MGKVFTSRGRGPSLGGPWRDAAHRLRAGYQHIYFTLGNNLLHCGVHRAVWMWANKTDIPESMEIDHLDFCRSNNQISNLELVTPLENMRRMKEAGHACGGRPPRITEEVVRQLRSSRETSSALARRYDIDKSHVCRIRRGLTRAAVA